MNDIYWNLNTPALYEQAIRCQEGIMAHLGPLIVRTGHHTGRSANDKFIAQEPTTEKDIWWGKINRPIPAENFDELHPKMFMSKIVLWVHLPNIVCQSALLRTMRGIICLPAIGS